MLPISLQALCAPAEAGLAAADDLLAGVDRALLRGLARPGPAEAAALTDLAAAVVGTPLGAEAGEAIDKILNGSADAGHLSALAGARAAVLGAVHDALLGRFDEALGRSRDPFPAVAGGPPSGPGRAGEDAGPLAAARAWLQELALVGWQGVDHEIATGGGQAITALLTQPALRRAAVLLDGLAAELRACAPLAATDPVPIRRWADLWTRALLLSGPAPAAAAPAPVSGRLHPLGVDIHEHPTAVQVQVHGLLEPGGGEAVRLVRWSAAAAKVDTVSGPALWQLFADLPVLCASLAHGLGVEVEGMSLSPSGDLLWDERRARTGDPVDPFTSARLLLPDAVAASLPPVDRHPVHLREPVLVEGYTTADTDDGELFLRLGAHELAVDVDQLPGCGPLTPALVAGSEACLGLLRHDGGRWRLQPLAVRATVKPRRQRIGTGDWALGPTDPAVAKAVAKTQDPLAVLRERAGKLLRA